jgi:CelD/BcsL family acetyltransferase involved in cellulose biosynthesis
MTKPIAVTSPRAMLVDGLPPAIDAVAAVAAVTHRFLRRGWYAAALAAYGGSARTLVVEEGGRAVLAMPLVATGPRALRLASVPGSYWPFRSFPLAADASAIAIETGLATLARHCTAIRIGPVADGDPAATPLLAAARARGWTVIDRFVADGWLLDMGELATAGAWPRASTLKKNRFHEKHLGTHGALDWSFVTGADWPAGFDALAAVERASWVATRTDGRDAKFLTGGHAAFWRAAVSDPVLAGMCRAALLRVAGRPAAFSFDLEVGETTYAIANGYDPAFAKHSPGKLTQWRNLADAVARGVRTVDWGAGDSGYKQVIGATQGPALRDWLLLRPGLPALAGRLLRGAWARSGQARAAPAA